MYRQPAKQVDGWAGIGIGIGIGAATTCSSGDGSPGRSNTGRVKGAANAAGGQRRGDDMSAVR